MIRWCITLYQTGEETETPLQEQEDLCFRHRARTRGALAGMIVRRFGRSDAVLIKECNSLPVARMEMSSPHRGKPNGNGGILEHGAYKSSLLLFVTTFVGTVLPHVCLTFGGESEVLKTGTEKACVYLFRTFVVQHARHMCAGFCTPQGWITPYLDDPFGSSNAGSR